MRRLDLDGFVVAVLRPEAYTRSMPQQPIARPAADSIGLDLHKRESQLRTITEDGERRDARMRWLLVEAAWRVLRSSHPALAGLNAWALRIAARRGKRIATVALARRVAGILYAMWRDDVPYRARSTTHQTAA